MNSAILPRAFYDRPTEVVAQELLGMILVRQAEDGLTAGRIVETEAYLSSDDAACHAVRGKTRSNASMFGPPGHAYVYPIHARHCANAVTGPADAGTAVLIRAIEPTEGIQLMQERRQLEPLLDLARGPARTCQAMAIDRDLDGCDLTTGTDLWIAEEQGKPSKLTIRKSRRIGVTAAHELPLRFFVADSRFVSGTKSLNGS